MIPQARPTRAAIPREAWGPLALLCCALLTGCQKQESKVCTDALAEGRRLVRGDELLGAEEQLRMATDQCETRRQAHVVQLGQEITAKKTQLKHLAEIEAKGERARTEAPTKALVDWVERRRAAADKSEGDTRCAARGDERFGWCDFEKPGPSATKFSAVFHRSDADAFRYRAELRLAAVCDDLDVHRVVRQWTASVDGREATRSHCEFLSKGLRGLGALITTVDGVSTVDMFSREYLNRDEAYRAVVEREGR
jgi:hypothetical protein